uniref:Uncharacterized protein n=1 Tax=Setaria italica TaxID=4555 RepID=K3XTK2_SETIT
MGGDVRALPPLAPLPDGFLHLSFTFPMVGSRRASVVGGAGGTDAQGVGPADAAALVVGAPPPTSVVPALPASSRGSSCTSSHHSATSSVWRRRAAAEEEERLEEAAAAGGGREVRGPAAHGDVARRQVAGGG